jgi:hypothetical protein
MANKDIAEENIERAILEQDKINSFFTSCIKNDKPIIFENIFSLFPDLGKFNFNYLQKILGNKIINVNGRDIVFDQYCKLLEEYSGGNELYLWQQSLEYAHPEIKPFFNTSALIPLDEIVQSNLWVGPRGTKCSLHYDLLNNFFFQLYGSKTFYLVRPNSLFKLYPVSIFGKIPNSSKVDLTGIYEKDFPKLKEVKIFKVNLQAGSCLFLPSCWWHQVISNENSISINTWTKRPLFELVLEKFQMLPLGLKLWAKSLIQSARI